jgi:hypothetical protein
MMGQATLEVRHGGRTHLSAIDRDAEIEAIRRSSPEWRQPKVLFSYANL